MEAFERLLDRARQGDAEALSILYRQFLPGIFGYIAARVPDRATAEDLTADVFLQMVEGIYALKASDKAGFTAWLLRITRITVAGYYRKREKQPVHFAWPDDDREDTQVESQALLENLPPSDPAYLTEAREDWQEVVQAINKLTEEQRQVLISRLILGYDVATVAQMIGKKVNAVKALQFRALQSLQRLLGKRDGKASISEQKKKEKVE